MERAVHALVKTLPGVLCALYELQAMHPTEKQALSLAKMAGSHSFIGALAIMADVLPILAKICTLFQTIVRSSNGLI